MANCGISAGLDCPTCEEIQYKGGAAKNLYIIDREDLDETNPYNVSANGTVTGFNFTTYGFAYKYCAKNKSNSTNQELQQADNGIKLYIQTITGKFQQQSQDAKNVIDDLKIPDDLIVVVETNNNTFEVFGLEAGVQITALVKPSGVAIGDDNTYTFTFSQPTGGETILAPDFFNVSYANTKALLENYTE